MAETVDPISAPECLSCATPRPFAPHWVGWAVKCYGARQVIGRDVYCNAIWVDFRQVVSAIDAAVLANQVCPAISRSYRQKYDHPPRDLICGPS
jgi:hypothetical protein